MNLDAILQGTPFRAVGRIGAGGMGEIYEAIGPFGGDPVVVKILRADLVDRSELAERLRREGEILQVLSHPNIVVSHGHGTTGEGRPYVVLERLVGSTLHQELLRRRAFPLGEAIAYARQLLAALEAVHGAGVVHRDVKPGNVMVCPIGRSNRIKLLDFGIAKVQAEARRHVAPISFPTREGLRIGTPRYFSPEQASGRDVDGRTDIYAVGLLLYRMIAGRGPFDEAIGAAELVEAHIEKEAPAPSQFMAAPLEPLLESIVMRAIAKNPEERFADASSFRRELGRAWNEVRGPRRGVTVRRIPLATPYAYRATHRCRIRAIEVAPPSAIYGGAPMPRSHENDGPFSRRSWAGAPLKCGGIATTGEPSTVVWHGPLPSPTSSADARNGRSGERIGGRQGERSIASSATPRARPRSERVPGSRFACTPISRRGVFCSAAAFFAVAAGLAMWFVR